MLGRVILACGIHTIACVRVGRKRYHATYYLVGKEYMLQSLERCNRACPQAITIPQGISENILQRIAAKKISPKRKVATKKGGLFEEEVLP